MNIHHIVSMKMKDFYLKNFFLFFWDEDFFPEEGEVEFLLFGDGAFIDESEFLLSKEDVFLDEFFCLFAEEDGLFSVCFPDEFEGFFSTEDFIFLFSGEEGFLVIFEVLSFGEEFEVLLVGEEDFVGIFWFLFPEEDDELEDLLWPEFEDFADDGWFIFWSWSWRIFFGLIFRWGWRRRFSRWF